MARNLNRLDWSLIETFVTVAETGSLSAASRRLGCSQPTVGRQVREIETTFGAPLFRRRSNGMILTEEGMSLIEPARAMRQAAGHFSVIAAGATDTLQGNVRITASVFAAHHFLPPIVGRIRRAEPDIALDLISTDTAENLLFREADIAVRMFRPSQLDVVTQHIGDMPLGLYGAVSYLDAHGRPTDREDLVEHDFVGYDTNDRIIRGFREAGWDVDRDFFRTRCDAQAAYWELVRAGCGLGFGAMALAETDPIVEKVDLGIPIPSLPVWLTAHAALRDTPRIRRVWDMLADDLAQVLS